MKPVEIDRGPFRSVALAQSPSVPARFLFRHDDHQMVLAGRRPFEPQLKVFVAELVALVGLSSVLRTRGVWLVSTGIFACLGATWAFAKFWERTTLILGDEDCSVVYRGLFRTRRLRAPLRSLEVVGVSEINPTPNGRRNPWPVYALQLSVGGSQALVLRGVPRQDLEWVVGQLRTWKNQRSTD